MTVLLDTHTLFWAGEEPSRLGKQAQAVIGNADSRILVSAASAWEIATKVRLGRFPEAASFEKDFQTTVQNAGFTILPITVEDALMAGRMFGAHGDPFDRMIAAQALALDIAVISKDAQLDVFGVRRIW